MANLGPNDYASIRSLIATRQPVLPPLNSSVSNTSSNSVPELQLHLLYIDSFSRSIDPPNPLVQHSRKLQRIIKMAIYSAVPPPEQQVPDTPATVQQFVESANLIGGLAGLSLSPSGRNGISSSILFSAEGEALKAVRARKEPMKRDSMKRREALLRGTEGSRRRQRWENGTSALWYLRIIDWDVSFPDSASARHDPYVLCRRCLWSATANCRNYWLIRSSSLDAFMHVPNAQPPLPSDVSVLDQAMT